MFSGASIQILLVAELSSHLELIRTALMTWDQKVDITIACTLADARVRMEENRPDLAIVDLFYRCPTQTETEGTGVGLASVKMIAELYGGNAWVEDTPGGGSTFWVMMADETVDIEESHSY